MLPWDCQSFSNWPHELNNWKDGYTMDQFLICAAAEKLSAFATEDYLKMRTGRADLEAFDRVMSRVPDVPPDAGDELP